MVRYIKIKKDIYLKTIVAILTLFTFQRVSAYFGKVVANSIDFSIVDVDNTFMWISIHHIVQMVVAVIAIIIIKKFWKLDFGFNFKNKSTGFKHITIFSIIMLVYVLLIHIIGYAIGTIQPYNYDLNANNVIGTLGFQLLLSGTSEEILFRALPITVLSSIMLSENSIKIKKITISSATIFSAILFSVAHVGFSFKPFTISSDLFQLIYAFVLGVVYGFTYEKTKSIVYPMAMHGLSNFIMVGIGYIFMALH